MEEMEADNMDQNLGMENQDLSRGKKSHHGLKAVISNEYKSFKLVLV